MNRNKKIFLRLLFYEKISTENRKIKCKKIINNLFLGDFFFTHFDNYLIGYYFIKEKIIHRYFFCLKRGGGTFSIEFFFKTYYFLRLK